MILVKRKAKELVKIIYEFLDKNYQEYKNGNIKYTYEQYTLNGEVFNMGKTIYDDILLKEEIKNLFIADGWTTFDVIKEHVPEIHEKYDSGGSSWTKAHDNYYIMLKEDKDFILTPTVNLR